MANGIERQFGAKGLHAFSLHPGSIGTELQRHVPQDQLSGFAQDEYLATSSCSTTNWAIGKGEGQAWIPNLLKGVVPHNAYIPIIRNPTHMDVRVG
jgi:hypothetical protein